MKVHVNPRTNVSSFMKLVETLVIQGEVIKTVSIYNIHLIKDDERTLKTLGISKSDLKLSVSDWLSGFNLRKIPFFIKNEIKINKQIGLNMLEVTE